MENNFKVGDRIEVTSPCSYAKNGMRGTVIEKTDWGAYAVMGLGISLIRVK